MWGGERSFHIDTLKFLSIFLVYCSHFIGYYHDEYFSVWPANGAKIGVAFFSVCVGYFAFQSKEKIPLVYLLRRYFYFVLCGFAVNVPVAIATHKFSLHVFSESIKLGSGYNAPFWCIFSFFVASVVSYFNAFYKVDEAFVVLEVVLLWVSGQTWTGICLLGNLGVLLQRQPFFLRLASRRLLKFFLLLAAAVLLWRENSNSAYLLYGISSLVFLLVAENSNLLKKIFGCRFLARLGRNVMAIYLFHVAVFVKLGGLLFNVLGAVYYPVLFVLVCILCWVVTVVFSVPMNFMLQKILFCFSKKIKSLFSVEA